MSGSDTEYMRFPKSVLPPSLESRRLDIPPIIYHYTDAAGLLGILQTRTLRASHVYFMNDTSELAHGKAIAAKVLAAKLNVSEDSEWLADSPLFFDMCLACFSADGDTLSQWRAYANDGAGYAIGFHSSVTFSLDPYWRPELLPVVYRERDQEAVVAEALPPDATSIFEVRDIIPLLKNPGFAEEQEWRVVIRSSDVTFPFSFKASRFGLTPYVDLKIGAIEPPPERPEYPPLLPLAELVLGPKLCTNEGEYAAVNLLRTLGYWPEVGDGSGLVIRRSRTPYR